MQADDIDRRILRYMQADPTLAMVDLADQAGVTSATCWRRIERMTTAGIIQGQKAVIDWGALGYDVEVSLRVTLDKTQSRAFDDFLAGARDIPEVIEIQTFLGQVDVRLNVLARDMTHYQEIYRERILNLPHIADIEALMLISELTSGEALPI